MKDLPPLVISPYKHSGDLQSPWGSPRRSQRVSSKSHPLQQDNPGLEDCRQGACVLDGPKRFQGEIRGHEDGVQMDAGPEFRVFVLFFNSHLTHLIYVQNVLIRRDCLDIAC
jgi:hypothetical protein